jgi:hypothetical protein
MLALAVFSPNHAQLFRFLVSAALSWRLSAYASASEQEFLEV